MARSRGRVTRCTRVRGIDIDAGVVDAEHDGYLRLPGDVMHRRWLIAPPHERTHLIVDLITGGGIHKVRTTWRCTPASGRRSWRTDIATRGGEPVLQLLHAATEPITFEDSYGNEGLPSVGGPICSNAEHQPGG